jgi:2,5-dihydroxypyridine 5,6-dioxygenase
VTEWRWIEPFLDQLQRCELRPGETVALLSESASRPALVATARLAAQSLGAQLVDVCMPTPPNDQAVAIRSTGASRALQGNRAAIAALAAADLVIDCTVEGILHAPELGAVLAGGARVLMISNEDPENFERYVFDPDLARRVELGRGWMADAQRMHVTSRAGTDLVVGLLGAFVAGSSGVTTGPGSFAHWPGGLVAAYPTAGQVNGRLVLATGDLNLTFKRYVESPVALVIVDDHVVDVEGDGVDADLFSSYLSAFGDREARATSHVGWGMNPHARWDYFELYDKSQVNGTEARAYAGNFLYSTGANEHAGRFTAGHFDLPLRNCTIALDGRTVVEEGRLIAELAPAARTETEESRVN